MKEIDELQNLGATLSLDALVVKANELLPRVLPDGEKSRHNELNPRLVRHFSTLGLLDEAGRAGREARYGARHLLQLLVVRRLMADGLTTGAIKHLVGAADNAKLEAILSGEAKLSVDFPGAAQSAEFALFAAPISSAAMESAAMESAELEGESEMLESAAPSNDALQFLNRIKARASPRSAPSRSASPAPRSLVPGAAPNTTSPRDSRWTRIEIWPGLELHWRADFRAPNTPHERALLLERLETALKNRRKSS